MKIKYICAALILTTAFSLTGCGNYDNSNNGSSDAGNSDAGKIANDIGRIFDGNDRNEKYNADNNTIENGLRDNNNADGNIAGGESILDGYNDPNFPNYVQDDLKINDNGNYEANIAGEVGESSTSNSSNK